MSGHDVQLLLIGHLPHLGRAETTDGLLVDPDRAVERLLYLPGLIAPSVALLDQDGDHTLVGLLAPLQLGANVGHGGVKGLVALLGALDQRFGLPCLAPGPYGHQARGNEEGEQNGDGDSCEE